MIEMLEADYIRATQPIQSGMRSEGQKSRSQHREGSRQRDVSKNMVYI